MHAVETTDLTKYYQRGAIKALESVSLTVEQGKIFSLLGPNGAGKTTLIKLLLGIVFPTRGSARLLGRPIRDHTSHFRIGYLAENHRFPEFLSARQVLYYYGKMSGVEKAVLEKRIPVLLTRVKLGDWMDVRIRKFSKGMLQRMGLAQALINDPDLLFLDEPTDGIDPVGRREVRDLLVELRNRGKTIFLNSHLLSEVERVSDEAAILKNGRLLRMGTISEFISVDRQFFLELGGGEESLPQICREMDLQLIAQNGHFLVTVGDDVQLNALIDRLRDRQIIIRGITPRKISLEDFFIEVIEDKAGVSS